MRTVRREQERSLARVSLFGIKLLQNAQAANSWFRRALCDREAFDASLDKRFTHGASRSVAI